MWSRREFRFDQFRRNMFERGDLKYVILDQLKDKPAHGYELIKALEERFGGFYAPSPGAIYPTLQMLEDMGYVSSVQEDGRKIYSITDAGRTFMTERRPQVDEVFSRMKERSCTSCAMTCATWAAPSPARPATAGRIRSGSAASARSSAAPRPRSPRFSPSNRPRKSKSIVPAVCSLPLLLLLLGEGRVEPTTPRG